MPKNKTSQAAAKRIRVTGSGKLRRQKSGLRHNLERKPSTLTRRLAGTDDIAPADTRRIKRMLGL
ncbi:MAG TPA: 50S ribosomal protein L35 [Mycobacteriales bacterium]|nr:50S ribosomal protein L35 [Mycobacteriales bacterium]